MKHINFFKTELLANMRKITTYFLSAILGIMVIAGCSGESQDNQRADDGRELNYTEEITFLDEDGEEVTTIQSAVAETEDERNEGLMNVNDLPSDRGMLFIFDEQEPLSFWMANTPLSLDIMFVNEDMEIVRVHQNTQPFSEENFASDVPARYVIETNAGFSVNHDIREGMRVEF